MHATRPQTQSKPTPAATWNMDAVVLPLTGKGDEDKGTILQSVKGIRVKFPHINHAAVSVSFVCTPSCDPPSGASCSTTQDLRRDHHQR